MENESEIIEFAVQFAINAAERLDDLFGPGSKDGGCSLMLVHKSSDEWDTCEEKGEWDKPGDLAYKMREDFYVYAMDRKSTAETLSSVVEPNSTYIEIYCGDYCVSGHFNTEFIKQPINTKGGEA